MIITTMGPQVLKCQMSRAFTLFAVYFRHTIPSDYRCSVRIHNIAGPNPGPFSRRLEMSLCQPSSGWLPFLFWVIGKSEAAKREICAVFHMLCPRYIWPLTPLPPYSHQTTREALTFTCPAGGVIDGYAAHNYSILLCHHF